VLIFIRTAALYLESLTVGSYEFPFQNRLVIGDNQLYRRPMHSHCHSEPIIFTLCICKASAYNI